MKRPHPACGSGWRHAIVAVVRTVRAWLVAVALGASLPAVGQSDDEPEAAASVAEIDARFRKAYIEARADRIRQHIDVLRGLHKRYKAEGDRLGMKRVDEAVARARADATRVPFVGAGGFTEALDDEGGIGREQPLPAGAIILAAGEAEGEGGVRHDARNDFLIGWGGAGSGARWSIAEDEVPDGYYDLYLLYTSRGRNGGLEVTIGSAAYVPKMVSTRSWTAVGRERLGVWGRTPGPLSVTVKVRGTPSGEVCRIRGLALVPRERG